ncbi:MAG: right-handed parallel beta-helix repeat-containing protein [Methylocella sp.]
MIKITLLLVAGAFLACGLSAAPAQAGPNRTFVSGHGTDSGPCTRAAPCRTFAFALTQTAAGGEIDVLDPAAYGPVTITKSISIVNDGVGTAGIRPNFSVGNEGVTIKAGAGDSIHLRGLTIEGGSFSLGSGIVFLSGGNLAIENCVIRDFMNTGIAIEPSTSSSFSVSNTIVSGALNSPDAGTDGSGIFVSASGSAVVNGVLSKVTAHNNTGGILVGSAGGSVNVTVVDSVASNNTGVGKFGEKIGVGIGAIGAAAAVLVMVRNSVASNNDTGLVATGANATLRVAHSVVTGNSTGVSTAGGTILSYVDNDIDGNTNNNTGVLTVISTH